MKAYQPLSVKVNEGEESELWQEAACLLQHYSLILRSADFLEDLKRGTIGFPIV